MIKIKYKTIKIKEKKDFPADDLIVEKNQLVELSNYRPRIKENCELKDKAIYLPEVLDFYLIDWHIVRDSSGTLCAVPIKRGGDKDEK